MPTLGDDPALDAETRVPILVGTSVAFTVASSLVVLLRIYTRFVIVHSLGIDDYTMVAAAVLAVGVTVVTILQAQNGLGHHVWIPISAEETQIQLKALFAGEVLYNLSQILIKISFLMQYRRIFLDELTRLICFWLILFLTLWGVTQEFLVAFACIPVPLFIASMADKCISSSTVWYLTSIMNIITDFVIFLVPIPAIRNLALQLRQKLLVMSLFCLGFFTCIISIVRLFTLRAALRSDDAPWDNAPTSWWTVIELNCGILCASIATLRPLVRRFAPGSSAAMSAGNQGGPVGSGTHPSSRGKGPSRLSNRHYKKTSDCHDAGDFPMRNFHGNESQNGLKHEYLGEGSQASYDR
ncbi:hypothetical protein F503_03792 [Ophiostoma piceae UAMH 11346]|uniref:Rhodopsin domain-containing protein n=1 Tax=Ophiostoma piceae (strain UAMH 11346) TaxID=1262450 RepID=S3BXD3_OPHP1|nr:hypothetical protein F503_03792 [Ophiostoma piceae UAMH 11346]